MSSSPEALMKLLADLTGWTSQSLVVTSAYMQKRVYTSHDESHLTDEWGWCVGTTICGLKDAGKVDAYGKTLSNALWKLCEAVPERLRVLKDRHDADLRKAKEILERHLSHPSEPYR